MGKPKACLSTTPQNKPENRTQKSTAEIQDYKTQLVVNLFFVTDYRIIKEQIAVGI